MKKQQQRTWIPQTAPLVFSFPYGFYDYIHALTICHNELKKTKENKKKKRIRERCAKSKKSAIRYTSASRIGSCLPPKRVLIAARSASVCACVFAFVCLCVCVSCRLLHSSSKIFQRFFNDCYQKKRNNKATWLCDDDDGDVNDYTLFWAALVPVLLHIHSMQHHFRATSSDWKHENHPNAMCWIVQEIIRQFRLTHPTYTHFNQTLKMDALRWISAERHKSIRKTKAQHQQQQ